MTKRRIPFFTQVMLLSLVLAIFVFAVFGYSFNCFGTTADLFDDWDNFTTETEVDMSDSQMDFEEIIADIQETLVYDDTTVMSVLDNDQDNMLATDDKAEKINKITDKDSEK